MWVRVLKGANLIDACTVQILISFGVTLYFNVMVLKGVNE